MDRLREHEGGQKQIFLRRGSKSERALAYFRAPSPLNPGSTSRNELGEHRAPSAWEVIAPIWLVESFLCSGCDIDIL